MVSLARSCSLPRVLAWVAVALVLILPSCTLACSCLEPRSVVNSLQLVDYVFRARVVKRLKDVSSQAIYLVSVTRVFKGCDFKSSERIFVETGVNSALCGVTLAVNQTFVLAGLATPIVSQVQSQATKVKRAVSIGLCDFNVESSKVSATESQTLRQYNNRSCRPKCTSGADCATSAYCDAGTCQPYPTAQCTCTTTPCSTATCGVANAKCYNACGSTTSTCTAIFVDATGTRVC